METMETETIVGAKQWATERDIDSKMSRQKYSMPFDLRWSSVEKLGRQSVTHRDRKKRKGTC